MTFYREIAEHSWSSYHFSGGDNYLPVLLTNVGPQEFDQNLSYIQILSNICPAYD